MNNQSRVPSIQNLLNEYDYDPLEYTAVNVPEVRHDETMVHGVLFQAGYSEQDSSHYTHDGYRLNGASSQHQIGTASVKGEPQLSYQQPVQEDLSIQQNPQVVLDRSDEQQRQFKQLQLIEFKPSVMFQSQQQTVSVQFTEQEATDQSEDTYAYLPADLLQDYLMICEFIALFYPLLQQEQDRSNQWNPGEILVALLHTSSIQFRRLLIVIVENLAHQLDGNREHQDDFLSVMNQLQSASVFPDSIDMRDLNVDYVVLLLLKQRRDLLDENQLQVLQKIEKYFQPDESDNLLEDVADDCDSLRELNVNDRVSLASLLIDIWMDQKSLVEYVDQIYQQSVSKEINQKRKEIAHCKRELKLVRRDIKDLLIKKDALSVELEATERAIDYIDHSDQSLLSKRDFLKKQIQSVDLALPSKRVAEDRLQSDFELSKSEDRLNDLQNEELRQQRLQFYLQNVSFGVDYMGRQWWSFISFDGLFVHDDASNCWCYAQQSLQEIGQILLQHSNRALVQKIESARNLLNMDNAAVDMKSLRYDIEIKDADTESLYCTEIFSLVKKIASIVVAPYVNKQDESRYDHFYGLLEFVFSLKSQEDQISSFGELKALVMQLYKCATHISGKVSNKKKRSYHQFWPLLYAFSDHDIIEVKPADLKQFEDAIVKWSYLLTNSRTGSQLQIYLSFMEKALVDVTADDALYVVAEDKFEEMRERTEKKRLAELNDRQHHNAEDHDVVSNSSQAGKSSRKSKRLKKS
ncbi:hypothetical protein MIR68_008581 [Amoeboaphelidium protococcarum]|nr:hypothetical protein MIR68_008581 [Amoeboaphelidium protococcarum]